LSTDSVTHRIWITGSAAVVLAFAVDPLGDAPNAAALAVVFVAAIQALVNKPADGRGNVALLTLAAIIVSIAALEILNPNVPSLTVGLVGFRKTATFVLGVMIGLGWRGSRLQALRLTWWCLFVSASVSLVVHLALPAVEQSITRNAEKYTAMLSGETRMQGLLAGPFHVSMLGVFLFLAALAPPVIVRQRLIRVAAAFVGLACVYFAEVRTGLVALAIGVLAMMLIGGEAERRLKRLMVFLGLSILALIYITPLTDYARRFTAFRLLLDEGLADPRFLHRVKRWTESLDMIDRSPYIGFGSGSAGDTMERYFIGGEHVTAHNTFLKFAVEGGVIQGLLFASLCIALAFAVRPSRDRTRFGTAAIVSFLVFAVVGAAQEALPVAFGLAVILGLCVQRPSETAANPASVASDIIDPDTGERALHVRKANTGPLRGRAPVSVGAEEP
jgi:O-antigen ligase